MYSKITGSKEERKRERYERKRVIDRQRIRKMEQERPETKRKKQQPQQQFTNKLKSLSFELSFDEFPHTNNILVAQFISR